MPASNGYRIAVERLGNRVSLFAFHGGGSSFATASYSVRGRVSPGRIDASFGKLGRVSVRLETQRIRRGKLEEQCTGKPETIRYGVFVGTIRFRGEGGYTTVVARKAQGQLSTGHRFKCIFPNLRRRLGTAASYSRLAPPLLTASEGRHRAFEVEVQSRKGRRSIFFEAASLERRGRMEIIREAFADAPPASFSFVRDLSSATVHPPRPFQGAASFQRTPTGPRWSGALSVSFPGREDVRLAGPRFVARLVRNTD